MPTLLEKGIKTKLLNDAAKKEKLGRPPISEFHYWWTRKPLITSRAVLLAALSDELKVDELEGLAGLNGEEGIPFKRKPWKEGYAIYTRLYERIMRRARELYGEDLTVYDPFAGSGMIGFEALRLGLNVELADYNPVAYLIMKATIEYPKKFGRRLADDVEREGNRIIEELRSELGEFYPGHDGKEVKAYIWAWAVKCKWCGNVTPLVNDWRLSEDEYIEPSVVGGELRFEVKRGKSPEGNVARGDGRCLFCGREISNDDVIQDVRENKREMLLAVALEGKEFSTDVAKQKEAFERASARLREELESGELARFVPNEEIQSNGTVRAEKYLPLWRDLFNDRQLLLLASLARKIRETAERYAVKDEEHGRAVAAALAAWLAKHVDRNSRATLWDSSAFKIGHALTNRGLSMTWKHAETNPLVKFSGSLQSMLHDVVDALRFAADELEGTGRVEIRLASALRPPRRRYRLIVTDPPYYDDVPYGELSEFFYVWERRVLEDFFPEAFASSHVDVSESIDVGGGRSPDTFYARLGAAISNLRDSLEDDGLLVLFYAHRSVEVWEMVADLIWRSGFQITGALPISTENENNVIAQGKRSVYYSLVLTARRREENAPEARESEVLEEIRRELEENRKRLNELDYDQGELYLWTVGVALRVLTRYSGVKSFTSRGVARTALEYAYEVGSRFFVDYDMEREIGRRLELDGETLFYLSVLRGGRRELDYSEFNQIAKSQGLNQDAMEAKGLVRRIPGKNVKIRVNDAFSRGPLVEKEGESAIKGNSAVDWLHRCILAFSARPSLSVVAEHARGAGLSVDDFLALAKMVRFYETRNGLGDGEVAALGEILKYAKEYGGLDRWL
ncbi:MAG: DUF1156 domain-containing protein [Conexivisphaera sp.]